MGEPEVSVDIVVPTRNRPVDLARLVGSMKQVRHPSFRLLVIDQSDDCEPAARLIAASGRTDFVHVIDEHRGKSRALNLALTMSEAQYLAFTDDDCEVPTTWLTDGIAGLEREDAALLFGNVVAYDHDPDTEFVPAIEFGTNTVIRGPVWRSHGLIGMGANMFVRRDVVVGLGGFDNDLGPGGPLFTGEECELTYRVLQAGNSVVQSSEVGITHYGGRTTSDRVASDLINVGFFAVGAGYGKHLRNLEIRAVSIVAHEVAWISALVMRALVQRTRPLHIRRMFRFVDGIRQGLLAGPQWGRHGTPPSG